MRIVDMNWMMVEELAKTEDRCIMPLGSVEQHAYLSLATDMILAEKVSIDAAEPLNVPVYPCQPFGIASGFLGFPGTVSLSASTYFSLIKDLLDSAKSAGFRRIALVNGHGGNTPCQVAITEWLNLNPDCSVKLHDWWRAPKVLAKVKATDPHASHASWMENFPWTRLEGVVMPKEQKPCVDYAYLSRIDAQKKRIYLKEGNYEGVYERDDAEMLAIWDVAVAETRALLTENWD